MEPGCLWLAFGKMTIQGCKNLACTEPTSSAVSVATYFLILLSYSTILPLKNAKRKFLLGGGHYSFLGLSQLFFSNILFPPPPPNFSGFQENPAETPQQPARGVSNCPETPGFGTKLSVTSEDPRRPIVNSKKESSLKFVEKKKRFTPTRAWRRKIKTSAAVTEDSVMYFLLKILAQVTATQPKATNLFLRRWITCVSPHEQSKSASLYNLYLQHSYFSLCSSYFSLQ